MGDVDAALEIARAIPRGYWVRCRALCAVGTYQLKKGNATSASAILQEALEAARDTGPQGDGISVHMAHELEMERVVAAHVDGGDLDGAVRVLRQMSNGYQKVEAFRAIATAQAKARNGAAARATLKQAVDMLVPLAASTKKGEEEEDETEEDPYCSRRGDVAVLLARAGDLASGNRLAREIEGDLDFTVRQVAAYYVVANGPEEALTLAEKETDPAMRCDLYHGIAMGLLHLAKVETSTSWLIGSDWLMW